MSKYNSKKITVGGMTFDSRKEAKRFQELYLMERAGKISDLQRQVKFVLIPAQREPDTIGPRGGTKKGALLEKECSYYADFAYRKNDAYIVEDVKGYRGGGAYATFSIKRKLMLWIHGIRVREV